MKFSPIQLFHRKTRVLIYFFHDCLWKQLFASNLPQSPSNLIFWTFFGSYEAFQFEIRATKLPKTVKFCLT